MTESITLTAAAQSPVLQRMLSITAGIWGLSMRRDQAPPSAPGVGCLATRRNARDAFPGVRSGLLGRSF